MNDFNPLSYAKDKLEELYKKFNSSLEKLPKKVTEYTNNIKRLEHVVKYRPTAKNKKMLEDQKADAKDLLDLIKKLQPVFKKFGMDKAAKALTLNELVTGTVIITAVITAIGVGGIATLYHLATSDSLEKDVIASSKELQVYANEQFKAGKITAEQYQQIVGESLKLQNEAVKSAESGDFLSNIKSIAIWTGVAIGAIVIGKPLMESFTNGKKNS